MDVDIDVSNEEFDQEVDHPNDVVDNEIGIDDIDDEYLTKNDFDNYPDISDLFNYRDLELDDETYVELDEEEYEWHCRNVGIQEVCENIFLYNVLCLWLFIYV